MNTTRTTRRSTIGGPIAIAPARRRRSTKAQLNVTIDLDPPPGEITEENNPKSTETVRPCDFRPLINPTSSSSTSSLSSTSVGHLIDDECVSSSKPQFIVARPQIEEPSHELVIGPDQDNDPLQPSSFDARSVPKSFDMFLSDIRKSSSTLDIHAASNSGNAVDGSILSTDDVPLNCTFKISPKKPVSSTDQPIDNRPGAGVQCNKQLPVADKKSALPRSVGMSGDTVATSTFRSSKLNAGPQSTTSGLPLTKQVLTGINQPFTAPTSRMPRPSGVYVASSSSTNRSSPNAPMTSNLTTKSSRLAQPSAVPRVSSITKSSLNGYKTSPNSAQSRFTILTSNSLK